MTGAYLRRHDDGYHAECPACAWAAGPMVLDRAASMAHQHRATCAGEPTPVRSADTVPGGARPPLLVRPDPGAVRAFARRGSARAAGVGARHLQQRGDGGMGRADEVEVRTRFDGRWTRGFELHDVDPDDGDARFRVRRQSDGVVLPDWFAGDEIRPRQTPRDDGPR